MTDDAKMRVGFVGIGQMGGAIAGCIVRGGFPLTVWARRPEAAAALVDVGATLAPDIAALAQCDLVGICVVDDAGVIAVTDVLLPMLRDGAIILINSTINPETCRRIATEAAARGIAVIDAPVSDGAGNAAAGKLTVMAGGDADAIERARPVIETFAGLFLHLGPLGAGLLAKLVNNSLMVANLAAADAARDIAAGLGIDLAMLDQLIASGSGRSFSYGLRASLPSLDIFGGGAKLLKKDTELLDTVALASGIDAGALTGASAPFLAKFNSSGN